MTNSYEQLPGPKLRWWGLPLLRDMARDYLAHCHAMKNEYGDWVRLRVVQEHLLDVHEPDAQRRLLIEHHEDMIRWERGTEVFAQGLGQSVLVTEGATWQRQRRVLMPAFTPKRMAGYGALMLEAAQAGLRGQEGPRDMGQLFSHLTMDVILRTLFGTQAAEKTATTADAVQALSEVALKEMLQPFTLPDWLPLPGKAAKRRALREVRGVVEQGLRQARPGTLATELQAARSDSGEALSQAECFAQCVTLFQAGHETSATALLWWSWLIATHPEEQQRLQQELDAVLTGRAPTGQDELPRLNATLKEAMRLYPPIAALMPRRLLRPIVFDGLQLPAGLTLRFTLHTLHHDPRWWPEPEAFKPERFLPEAPAPVRGSYMPFGVGPRVCLGQHFAMQEMQLIAAQLLQHYTLHPLAGEPPPHPRLRVTLRPLKPLLLELRPRGLGVRAHATSG